MLGHLRLQPTILMNIHLVNILMTDMGKSVSVDTLFIFIALILNYIFIIFISDTLQGTGCENVSHVSLVTS